MTEAVLEQTKHVILVTGYAKEKETQRRTLVAHEVRLPADMSIADLLEQTGGRKARSLSVLPNFKHDLETLEEIGREYEILSYGDAHKQGEISALAYEISRCSKEKLAAFVKKYEA
ncbi:hypothetical protein KY346_04780 [Candidatus Woesearchaeota archaeon]|nr:hypothetical protein [Candidatus Woesearchaeota archaeon]